MILNMKIKSITQQFEPLTKEQEKIMKNKWWCEGKWHDGGCEYLMHVYGVCRCEHFDPKSGEMKCR